MLFYFRLKCKKNNISLCVTVPIYIVNGKANTKTYLNNLKFLLNCTYYIGMFTAKYAACIGFGHINA